MKLPLAIALTLCRAPSNELPCGPTSLVMHRDTAAHLLVRTSVTFTILPSWVAFFFSPNLLIFLLKATIFTHTAVLERSLSKLVVVHWQSREAFHFRVYMRNLLPNQGFKMPWELQCFPHVPISKHQDANSLTPFSPGIFAGLPNHAEPQQKGPGDNPGTFLPWGQFGFSLRSSCYLRVQMPGVCNRHVCYFIQNKCRHISVFWYLFP